MNNPRAAIAFAVFLAAGAFAPASAQDTGADKPERLPLFDFAYMDTNRDGVLISGEFAISANMLFDRIDRDGSASLSRTELRWYAAWLRKHPPQLALERESEWPDLDRNRRRLIEPDAFVNGLWRGLLERHDADRDGRLLAREYPTR